MATNVLTTVASRARRPIAPASKPRPPARDWRELIHRQEADAIWHELSSLVEAALPGGDSEHDAVTQEIFLELVSTGRISDYIQQDYSGEEIYRDINVLIAGRKK